MYKRQVRVSLFGGEAHAEVVGLFAGLDPPGAARDLDAVLLIDHLASNHWVDAAIAEAPLQRSRGETEAAIERALRVEFESEPVLAAIKGIPANAERAYRLSDRARTQLAGTLARLDSPADRSDAIVRWAHHRGRVSSTEVADLLGLSVVRAGQILTELENGGLLAPGRETKAGRGFFYVPATD